MIHILLYKIRFIYVGNHLKFPFWLFETVPNFSPKLNCKTLSFGRWSTENVMVSSTSDFQENGFLFFYEVICDLHLNPNLLFRVRDLLQSRGNSSANSSQSQLQGVPEEVNNKMLLGPWCTCPTTSCKHPLICGRFLLRRRLSRIKRSSVISISIYSVCYFFGTHCIFVICPSSPT